MLWRVRNSRGRPRLAPPDFIHPCRPTVSQRPPRGEGWVHELKHEGYRLQIHVRDGRVKLYTMNAANWSDRYPRIVETAARLKGAAIIDAEVVCLDAGGHPHFDTLHGRCADHLAIACAFDLLMLNGDDLRCTERKAGLRKFLRRSRERIQYVEHVEGDGDKMFAAVCELGLEGIVSKRMASPYRSGPSKAWLKTKNPKAPVAMRGPV